MTVIDTPGFGKENFEIEDKYIYKIIDFLKSEMKFVHVFVVTLDGRSRDFNNKVRGILRLFGKIFGDRFWKHVMFEATKWSFSGYGEELRKDQNPPMNEYVWSENLKIILRNESNIPVSILHNKISIVE